MQDDLPYWLALNQYPKFGPRRMARLFAHFESMQQAFQAPADELAAAGIPEKIAAGFVVLRDEINPMRLWREVKKYDFNVVTIADDAYPPLLKSIYDPPALLFVRGQLPDAECAHLAVVGSRRATSYGLEVTKKLISDVAEAGVVVASGLAHGIDEAAHVATLQRRGTTIAVIACGLLKLSGRQKYLAEQIASRGGAVVSEFPLLVPAQKHHFPIRNRVISGLCHGTLVVEAAERSGSLITARSALEQGRDVFAVPGSINSPTCAGTNNLLKMGAHVATCAADLLDVLQVEHVIAGPKSEIKPDSPEEAAILEYLSKSPIHIDEITRSTQLDAVKVASALSLMEMKGQARQIGGMYYILI